MSNLSENLVAAKAAGLRYVSDSMPGIRRRRRGRTFEYHEPDGRTLRDATTIGRIRSLDIPPAYEDVWICPIANGHLQATGRDDRRRKQYRYHPLWREIRDETKFDRMLLFAKALPELRKAVETDLRRSGMPREKILATVVRLLETTSIRVGNEVYARTNHSYGLTTLEKKQAQVRGQTIDFTFRGKSGVNHDIKFHDGRLAKIIHMAHDLPGLHLFEYLDEHGKPHAIESGDVNEYIRRITGGDFTAKDFRTWVGSVQSALILSEMKTPKTQAERKAHVVDAIKAVAERLGNTPAVSRKYYIHPQILAAYLEDGTIGTMIRGKRANGLLPEERFVVQFLKRRERQTPAERTMNRLRESLRQAR
jgi:DNA topoisomerase I